ncbi:necdin-like 2 [Salarias fasciatus]|uniref:Non-structural maintenance of chromosomes element 3 homolog n=1 Tax=Salarias fasciatus TaxID=181472 RepID=A0A672H9Y0_SALFA|nr:non-structural maintenance of chromosomes element 3 homolog [Salarias fasciatus]
MAQRKRLSGAQTSSQAKRPSGSQAAPEDEDDQTFTLPSSSQVLRGMESLAPGQLEQKTAEVVQYFLVKDQKKFAIRRADIVKHVLKEQRNIYPEVMRRAAATFQQVFGLKLVEIEQKNHLYILINSLEPSAAAPPSSSTNPKTGLLFVVLGLIFMKGGVARENVVWSTLKKLRIDPREKHEEFGDVRKLLTEEFVRQRYLEYIRIPHTDPVEFEFGWGQRAEYEVSKPRILSFMGELHQQDPQTWSQQYREAHSSSSSTPSPSPSQR